ncbi:MAG: hypothetical protein DMG08_02705 [Acidobacteria bacterium]|nr:MAG: hypothetical protein DMG08_02705 [Acidobacteriota bacterium]
MRKAAVSLIGVLCCTAILALAHDPRTTAKDFSHGLKIEGAGDLNLSYKAMHFNVATYKRMQEDGQFRARMNSGVWSNIGAAEAGFDVILGDQALPRGKYTLGLSIDAQDAFSMVFKGADKTVQAPMKVTSDNPEFPYLTFAIYPTDKPDIFVLEGRCGKYRGTVDLKVPYLAEHTHAAPKN